MKILGVHLRNLNSLAGSWAIDFTAPEYENAGIFAITGPTGSGKSTILDAVCLALFARTPRLGHISKGSNEIMSRRTGDCFAEVEFATAQGRFRCHWSQRRARRSPDGELQSPRHELIDAGTGAVMESRAREVVRQVERITGMDYDRFTRSMLLAQGGFAAFLEADADQRAPILEQITGTGIYSDISIAVHGRTSEERRKTEVLEGALAGVALLGAEEEAALRDGLAHGQAEAERAGQRLAALDEALHRTRTIAAVKEQISTTEAQQRDWRRRGEQEAERLHRLEQGLQAQALAGVHARWLHLRERAAGLDQAVAELRAGQQVRQEEFATLTRTLEQARLGLHQALALQDTENELIKAVRMLDLHLHGDSKIIDQVATVLGQLAGEQAERQERLAGIAREITEISGRQGEIDSYLQAHGRDALLVEQLAGIQEQVRRLTETEAEQARLAKALEQARAAWAAAEMARDALADTLDQAAQALALAREQRAAVEARLHNLLAGRTAGALRAEAEAAGERLRQLTWLGEGLELHRLGRANEAAATMELQRLGGRREQVQQDLARLDGERQVVQERLAGMEREHRQALRLHAYAEDRRLLTPGDPCPLCGSLDHPYGAAQPSDRDGGEILAREKQRLEHLDTQVTTHKEALVGLSKDIEYTARAVNEHRQQRRQLEERIAPLLAALVGCGLAQAEQEQLNGLRLVTEARMEQMRQDLAAMELLEVERQKMARRQELAQTGHLELQHRQQEAVHRCEAAAREAARLGDELRRADERSAAARAVCAEALSPLGVTEVQPAQAEALLTALAKRRLRFLDHREQQETLARRRAQLMVEQDRDGQLLAALDKTLAERTEELAEANRRQEARSQERRQLFGERDPEVEEQRLKAMVRRAEVHLEGIGRRHAELDKELHGLAERRRLAGEELAAVRPQSVEAEAEFLAALPTAGFADPDAFASALLAPEQLVELGRIKEALDREGSVLTARLAEQVEALRRAEEEHRGSPAEAELVTARATLASELETLQQRIGADRERLAANSRGKQEQQKRRAALEAQRREQERWQLLHQLIGSADGKKFRVFAQGLTFDLMISHANQQLQRMNDRYLLLRDPSEPLELLVLDSYQAGEVRSTRNLSGGESFVVSLALALGLSAMASHNVRVESLFLDEGFGTLDEEALDTALQTLAELHRCGTLIGVISHVPLLQDRIEVRIQVLPGSDGCSHLIGPGCRRID